MILSHLHAHHHPSLISTVPSTLPMPDELPFQQNMLHRVLLKICLASMLHPRFWAKFFLMVLLLAGRNSYGTESKEADTKAAKRSRRDKNQAVSQNALRSLSTVG